MTMGFSIFSRLCDPSKKTIVLGLLALEANSFKVMSIILSGVLYDMSKWTPYFLLFCLVTIGLVTGFILIRVMPSALRRRSKVKVLLAATEISRSRCDINYEKRVSNPYVEFLAFSVQKSEALKRLLHIRLAFGNEETQGDTLALPYGRATEEELESIITWLKECVLLPPKTAPPGRGDLVPDLLKSLLGRWTTRMLEHHGYVNWYECDGEIEMLLNAGFPPLRLEPEHQRLMRLQDHYYSLERHLAACRAFSSKNPAVDAFIPMVVADQGTDERHPFLRTPLRIRVDFLIGLLCVFGDFLGDNLLAPSYEVFIQQHGPPGLEFGFATSLITAAYLGGRGVAASCSGTATDFLGRWNVLLFCTIATATGFLLQALAWDFWSLVGFRLLTGFVSGTRAVVVVYICDWVSQPSLLNFWMSLIPVVSSTSSFIGPLVGGIVAQADESNPLNPAYVGFALNAMASLLVILAMRKSPLDKDKRLGGIFKSSPRPSTSSVSERSINSSGSLVEWYAILLLIVCTAASNAGTQGWSVLLITIQKELHLSSLMIGLVSGGCGIMVIVGQLLALPFMMGKLRWSEAQVMLFGFTISLSIIVAGFVTSLWVTLIIGAVISLGLPLAMTVVFAMFSRLCDESVKGRVVGIVALMSNLTKVVAVLLTGFLYDIAKWIPYVMLFFAALCGIAASVALLKELPRALASRRSKKLLISATRPSAKSSLSESDIVYDERGRGLHHRLGFDYQDERQSTLGMPFGRASVDEIEEIMNWVKAGLDRRPRLPFESKAVIIPDLVKALLGRWTTRMLDAHGYRNWLQCIDDVYALLGNGFPNLRASDGATPSVDRRLFIFYMTLMKHLAACRGPENRGALRREKIPISVLAVVSRLTARPKNTATETQRIIFGRRLSDFLISRGYMSWPGWFADGENLHILLRSTFPPLGSKPKYSLYSLSVLAKAYARETKVY
ncbi:hypothetical protein FOL47_003678 [Perkinsus chesapeaki]|uniref:Major facilitator superfamily (MFS) profile domain-containing protein n=1 Tax=Perkinsus chesapeaki TaxID=330153 RepID=A0A7J6M6J2_PERCH|nr:hypothetical protein FOL47_003678 [Perkinsus chesapeaki]